MIDRNGKLQIIDFDRYDFGDPWEEFNRIVWCAQKPPLFASGMVNGYFDGDVPPDFWKLLALYISSNTLSSVYWAISFGQDEVDTMLNQASLVFRQPLKPLVYFVEGKGEGLWCCGGWRVIQWDLQTGGC